jgi:EmrB/QacA subfamily drug resistance transporter
MVITLAFAITTEAFPPTERGKALGIISTIVSVGVVIGPTLGGLIIAVLSWRWIFYVNLPIGIVGTVMILRFLPNFRPRGRQKFDYAGAAALLLSLLALLLALTLGQQLGFGEAPILLLFAGWLTFGIIFVMIEWRSSQPMIDPRLFRDKLFSLNLVIRLISFIGMAGTIILLPFYLENVLAYNTRQVGLLLVVVPVALGIVSPISGALSDRFGTRTISMIGLVLLSLSYYILSTLTAETTAVGYIIRLLLLGIGMGIFQSPNNSAIMGSAPPERLGITSGLLSITRTLGQVVGIAVIGAVWAGRTAYHAGAVLSEGVTRADRAAQVAGLQDTFLGTVGLIVLALGLSIWGLAQERRSRQAAPAHIGS